MRHPTRTLPLIAILALVGCTQTPYPASPDTPTTSPTTVASTIPPAQAPIAAGAPLPPPTGWPQTVTLPKLDVTALVVGTCATNRDGSIEPPADIHAACVTGRPDVDPVGVGVTVLTGHTTRDVRDGALERISRLTPGDTLTVAGHTWTITQIGTWPATELPAALFADDGHRRLILGTCHLDAAVLAGAPYTQTDLVVAVPRV